MGVVVLLIGVWFKEMSERKNSAARAAELQNQDQPDVAVEEQSVESAGRAVEAARE
jgi:hypothetical protein